VCSTGIRKPTESKKMEGWKKSDEDDIMQEPEYGSCDDETIIVEPV